MARKFEKKFWVLIKKCPHVGVWYEELVGTLQYVTDELSDGENIRYTLVDEPNRNSGIYSFIEPDDAEIINPTFLQKVVKLLNMEQAPKT